MIVFRVDASIKMGTGHVMRCLTLADALKERNKQSVFICRQHQGNLIPLIEDNGYKVLELPVPSKTWLPSSDKSLPHAKWLGVDMLDDAEQTLKALGAENIQSIDYIIIDHYALDKRWENKLKSYVKNIMVIDDLADRKHNCDFLLDQTFGRDKKDYKKLVSDKCTVLAGSQYALLRPEFARWRGYSLGRRNKAKFRHLLITMGGTDPENHTGEILNNLEQCKKLFENTEITVILGATSPHIEKVRKLSLTMSIIVDVKVGVSNMAEIMAYSDLAIGAAGATTWERCCLGVPSIVLVCGENQKTIASNLHDMKVVKIMDSSKKTCALLSAMLASLDSYSLESSKICNGKGVDIVLSHIE